MDAKTKEKYLRIDELTQRLKQNVSQRPPTEEIFNSAEARRRRDRNHIEFLQIIDEINTLLKGG